jgi:hypothetical protein
MASLRIEQSAVEFGIGVGEYEGVIRVGRRVFQKLFTQSPTPEHCLEGYRLHRTRLELRGAPNVEVGDHPLVVQNHADGSLMDDGAAQATLVDREMVYPDIRGRPLPATAGRAEEDREKENAEKC